MQSAPMPRVMHWRPKSRSPSICHGDAVVVALDRYRVVHPGGVALDADEEGVRGCRVCGQTEVSEDVGAGFAA